MMSSNRPYLLRALYEWIADHDLTPYILVNARHPEVRVPEHIVQGDSLVFNIKSTVVQRLSMDNVAVTFDARFSGVSTRIYAPIAAVTAIYAKENGRGMIFSESAAEDEATVGDQGEGSQGEGGGAQSTGGTAAHLRVIK